MTFGLRQWEVLLTKYLGVGKRECPPQSDQPSHDLRPLRQWEEEKEKGERCETTTSVRHLQFIHPSHHRHRLFTPNTCHHPLFTVLANYPQHHQGHLQEGRFTQHIMVVLAHNSLGGRHRVSLQVLKVIGQSDLVSTTISSQGHLQAHTNGCRDTCIQLELGHDDVWSSALKRHLISC